ncbi:CcdB family protein [Sulfitobacter geojensis]|uniref:CcdB family protein n=1 Tax=Sulfitobacter geojensis TaxID=1342299 RepID=UPI0024920387|nr:CcdB family protein [Sulfitobacter geojensis]
MAQFQVYRLGSERLVLDLQTDLIDTGSRVVAPLISVSTGPSVIGRLEPVFDIQGEDHALHTAEMAAVPTALLRGQPIADLSGYDYEIRSALDMVFSGF